MQEITRLFNLFEKNKISFQVIMSRFYQADRIYDLLRHMRWSNNFARSSAN